MHRALMMRLLLSGLLVLLLIGPAFTSGTLEVYFIDVATKMLDADGKPRPELLIGG